MSRGNMNAAYKRVMSNKSSGGIDNMGLDDLLPYLKSSEEELTESLLKGQAKPSPQSRDTKGQRQETPALRTDLVRPSNPAIPIAGIVFYL